MHQGQIEPLFETVFNKLPWIRSLIVTVAGGVWEHAISRWEVGGLFEVVKPDPMRVLSKIPDDMKRCKHHAQCAMYTPTCDNVATAIECFESNSSDDDITLQVDEILRQWAKGHVVVVVDYDDPTVDLY